MNFNFKRVTDICWGVLVLFIMMGALQRKEIAVILAEYVALMWVLVKILHDAGAAIIDLRKKDEPLRPRRPGDTRTNDR